MKDLSRQLEEKIDALYQSSEAKEVSKEEVLNEVDEKEEVREIEESEEEVKEDIAEEAIEEKEIEEVLDPEIERKISGQPKEFRELVKSVKDTELREKIIQAGKILRAREDSVRLENGNLKKDYANSSNLLRDLEKNPAEAIKNIARVMKIDLANLIEKTVHEDEEYLTSEEKAIKRLEEQNKQILSKLEASEKQKQDEFERQIDREFDEVFEEKDKDGNLKYPHHEKIEREIIELFAMDIKTNGIPKTTFERKERLTRSYQKAVLLNDELMALRDAEIIKKEQQKRQELIEKAKKEKRVSSKSSNVDVSKIKASDKLADAIGALYA